MDNIKNDFYYIKRLLKSIEITTRYLENKSVDDLLNDGFLCDAIENRFTKIAEDVNKLSIEFRDSIPTIPWKAVVSIRNRVCHDYDVVDASTLYKTIRINFPQFRAELINNITVHRMRLESYPFDLFKNRKKSVEMRLFDDKRKKLKVGDLIIFKNKENGEEIISEIYGLKTYKTFDELYANYKKEQLGYENNEATPNDMAQYYKPDQIKKFGTVAIEVKIY